MARIAFVNGDFVPLESASVPVLDRGFLFADGVYEVTAVIHGRLLDYDNHAARLERSLKEIELACPVAPDRLHELHHELIRRNALKEGVVYVQVTRGASERDYAFPAGAAPTLVMFTQEKNILDAPGAAKGIAVLSVPDLRWARCDIKSVGLLAQVLAKQAAAKAQCQEAWMTRDGFVTEGASSTAFILTRDRRIVTRALSNEVLPGVTRRAVMRLVDAGGLVLEERPFTLAEAYAAQEAFSTSASGFVMPIVTIDGRRIGAGTPGPVARELRRRYIEAALASLETVVQT
jgi:D-alanine transaminase